MPNITTGAAVAGLDFPASVYDSDDTDQLNLSNTGYIPGVPEVGVVFVAPTSGRVRLTVGGGLRDSSAVDRVFLSPQIFVGPSSSGTEFMGPSVTFRGIGCTNKSTEFVYMSRTSLVTGLTPGQHYYARLMFTVSPAATSANGTADVATRDISVIPVP